VIVLAPDNSGKVCNRWCGPATVIKVKSPHSYLVDMGDGNVRHVHANKMRNYQVLLAHPPPGTGPPYNFFQRRVKNWL